MQDFTGVPAVADLAAMRSEVARKGGDPQKINPLVPADLVIDHSVQVDFAGIPNALQRNMEMEFKRNQARYQFLKWGTQAFNGFSVVPPGCFINARMASVLLPSRVFFSIAATGVFFVRLAFFFV